MRPLGFVRPGDRLTLLALGAHSDDVEIGAGGTILSLIEMGVRLDVHWCVLSAPGERGQEAEASAQAFLVGAERSRITLARFRDGYFGYDPALKDWFEALKSEGAPDLVLTHRTDDAHQDHRTVAGLTWNSFRDQIVLEYEIPKWDGDLGRPNLYVPLGESVLERKIRLLGSHFVTQAQKDWFDPETFRGLARLRGAECRATERYAEAFVLRKGRLI